MSKAWPDLSCEVGGSHICDQLEASPSGFIEKSLLLGIDSTSDWIVGSNDIKWFVH